MLFLFLGKVEQKTFNCHSPDTLSENFQLCANFGLSKKSRPILLIENYSFVCDTKPKNKSAYVSSWRCSMYVKYLCKARACTKQIGGDIRYRITHPFHTH